MQINFDVVIKDIYDNDMTTAEKNDTKDKKAEQIPFTLRHAAVEGLLAVLPIDANIDGAEKLIRWELATKVHRNKVEETEGKVTQLRSTPLDLSPEEVSLIKKRIGDVYGTPIVGPCWDLLNG